jgi:predicted Zn-dependent protease
MLRLAVRGAAWLAIAATVLFACFATTRNSLRGATSSKTAQSLDDGRIGKIADSQGLVLLRPALAQRRTPVGPGMLLKPGDWLRTDLRGANALKVGLSSDVELTLGPGTLVECLTPTQARLHVGELQVRLPERAKEDGESGEQVSFELLAPRGASQRFSTPGKHLVRVDRSEKLITFEKAPQWLEGFDGASSNESLGSLIAKLPDGRNEPLSVGYHKVNVEIRDQIARTTIEESFANHTSSRLEGVFYFPLPADASISDFGMWIGNDLVEADVVEKQRAREIYETILREKNDPGLLEWTVGNLFKARVFPIEPSSEKRIKIVYTQVLPLRGNQYRYSYGLRSELLRSRPLRELSLSVQIHSALPLKSVLCPTHATRALFTEHSAQLDFAAQEYTPDRDFEVVCEVQNRSSDVVVIPHRRGENGYFLLQLMPPGLEGNWHRDVLPDGKPMQIVLVCDTSASMDEEKRKQQAEFVATVLSSLGEEDRFWLAAADVETVWASSDAMPATAENVAKARKFLEDRGSLGWTDLGKVFEEVVKKAPSGAQIVYVGDGIVTAGERDPNSFVKKLGRVIGEASGKEGGRSFHAVTVGNTYDATVLKGIAAVGHGSVRSISGDQTPQVVAKELLDEFARPGLRDLNMEFRGVKVAAVYPDTLPQVPAGTQQILVGRYLPTGNYQHGEVVVTGKLGDEPVRYSASVDLKDAEAGNSFIPRLWARAHLDHLLQQGASAAIRGEIIGLSEQFHIITPYTSLLVLESDADRERFGVKRHFEMRDGERFFAEGRDNANYELRQQQMKRAGDWRVGIRRQVLQHLSGLGRDPRMFQRLSEASVSRTLSISGTNRYAGHLSIIDGFDVVNSTVNGPNGGGQADFDSLFAIGDSEADAGSGPRGMGGAGGGGMHGGDPNGSMNWDVDGSLIEGLPAAGEKVADSSGDWSDSDRKDTHESTLNDEGISAELPMQPPAAGDEPELLGLQDGRSGLNESYDKAEFYGLGTRSPRPSSSPIMRVPMFEDSDFANKSPGFGWGIPAQQKWNAAAYGRRYYSEPEYVSWINTLFSPLPGPLREPSIADMDDEEDHEDSRGEWSDEAVALSNSLLRLESLWKVPGGIELHRTSETFDPRWKRTTSKQRQLTLYSSGSWVSRGLNPESQTFVSYCTDKERGIYSLATMLGRARKSVSGDLKTPPLDLADYSMSPLHRAMRHWDANVEPAGENQTRLILNARGSKSQQRFLIDTSRHVLLKSEQLEGGKVTSSTTFEDFVEVAGSWWARRVTTIDEKVRTTSQTRLKITPVETELYHVRVSSELAAKPQVQLLHLPGPTLEVARQHAMNGSADFTDRVALILYNCNVQQWDEVFKQVEAAEKLAKEKPGVRWLRTMILQTARRNDEARKRLLDEARKLATEKRQDEIYLAELIVGQSQGVASAAEQLEFVNILKPVYDRGAKDSASSIRWREHLMQCYDALGRKEDALALRGKLAQELSWETGRQTEYAQRLLQSGKADEAYAWLQKQLDRDVEFDRSRDDALRSAYAELYRSQARWNDLLNFTTAWIGREPEYSSAYTQHVSALVYNDQQQEADKLCERWIKEAQDEREISAEHRARLDAAISYAQGNVYGLPANDQTDERWIEVLASAAKQFCQRKDQRELAAGIFNDGRFTQSSAGDQFRGFVLSLLQQNAAKLSPEQVSSFVGLSLSGRIELVEAIGGRKQMDASEVPASVWKRIADNLRERWRTTKDADEKNSLSQSLQSIYSARFSDTELLPFLRERIETAPKRLKLAYINSLFDVLLSRRWTDDNEKEVFGLLFRLTDSKEESKVLTVEVPALHRLVDAMISRREERANEELRDKGSTDKLTRKELNRKKVEFGKAAKKAIAERLGETAKETRGPMVPWLRLEKAYLDVRLDQNVAAVEAFCWTVVGEKPPKPLELDEATILQTSPAMLRATVRIAFYESLLRARAFATLMNLAARRNADPRIAERVLKYIDAGIEQSGARAASWRATRFQLLVALDRADELERQLREWVQSEPATSPWREALAMLLAERGKLQEAIQIFESLKKDDLLNASAYRTLSDWYLATNRRDEYEKARMAAYKLLPEQNMNSIFWGLRSRWLRTDLPLPSQLDENTLFALRALFEKSANPENYFGELRDLYAACRDFRLLDMLPDAVLGRSPQQIYSFLEGMQSNVLTEMRNEATADEILGRVRKLRERTLTSTDKRALDLMVAVVERRASEVLNQPQPHVEACLAAMKRAFDRPVTAGEPVLIAGFLQKLGKLPHQSLVDEQTRELRFLQSKAKPTSRDHLTITACLCDLLFWSYERHDAALEEMEVEVRDYEQAHSGHWPHADNEVLGRYVHMLEGAKRRAAGEAILLRHLAEPENDDQRKWIDDRMLALYNSALESDAEVSLGKGDVLFRNLVRRGLKEFDTAADENVRQAVVGRLVNTFDIARKKTLASTGTLLTKFAFETIPAVLKKQHNQYRETASRPLSVIGESLGPKLALRYVVERIEQYPSRLETTWDNRWQTFGYELARWRHEAAAAKLEIADLESRALKLVTAEIQRSVRSGHANNQHIYYINWQFFWSEKADDFARAAEEVYEKDKKSGRKAAAVANYLWSGLNRYARAIEILLMANRDGVLDEGGQNQLAQWLQEQNRYAESIPVLEPLVERHPDSMRHRTMLMVAYHRTERREQLAELMKSTNAFFHAGGRWTDANVAEFGKACGTCELNKEAVAYLTEAISIHQRLHGEVVVGDAALSEWYQHLASAHSALGDTKGAVDAASTALVCWGPRQSERGDAINRLKDVLRHAKDLPAYIEHLDEETKKTGQDSPILRKSIGQVFFEQHQYQSAVAQLVLAKLLEPNDKEVHQALVACYDAMQDKAAGTRELLELIQLDSHNLALYQQLAERVGEQAREGERAVTSVIEAGAQEAENHAALAEIRQRQGRWNAAIDEWRKVSELRRLEPTGLVKLAEAQIHEKRWDVARRSIQKLQRSEWPARFGDVSSQARQLEAKLPKE